MLWIYSTRAFLAGSCWYLPTTTRAQKHCKFTYPVWFWWVLPNLITINQKIKLWAMGLCRCHPPPSMLENRMCGHLICSFVPCFGLVDFCNFEGACGRNNDQGVLKIFWLIVTGVVSKSVLPQTHKMQIFRGSRPSLSQTGAGFLWRLASFQIWTSYEFDPCCNRKLDPGPRNHPSLVLGIRPV